MPRRPKTPRWLAAARAAAREAPGASEKPDFVSRALARAGILPTAEAEAAVKAGRVRLDHRVVREPFAPVFAGSQLELDGQVVDVTPHTRVLAFHKPRGLVVQGHDAQGQGTVFEALAAALPSELRNFGWHAVGRLDRDTTGVLLFTNDERFVAHATAPETHLPKRYLVTVSGAITEEKLACLRRGVTLGERTTLPAEASLRSAQLLVLTLTEGKFHQVKLMMNAVQLATLALHREAVGDYVLDVDEGRLRPLTDDEIERLLHFTPRQRPPTSPT